MTAICLAAPCDSGDVRLAGNTGYRSGRVEVCVGEQWGSICTDGWDPRDASVICQQLGHSPYGEEHEGSVNIAVDKLTALIIAAKDLFTLHKD